MVNYASFYKDPNPGAQRAQNNLINAMQGRNVRAQQEKDNAFRQRKYDDYQDRLRRDELRTEDDRHWQLSSRVAHVVSKALGSAKDEKGWQQYRGFLQQIGQTPLGQAPLFKEIARKTPEKFGPDVVEEGLRLLSPLLPGGREGNRIEKTVDLGDRVEYIYTDGTREFREKGKSPGKSPSKDSRGTLAKMVDDIYAIRREGNEDYTKEDALKEAKALKKDPQVASMLLKVLDYADMNITDDAKREEVMSTARQSLDELLDRTSGGEKPKKAGGPELEPIFTELKQQFPDAKDGTTKYLGTQKFVKKNGEWVSE